MEGEQVSVTTAEAPPVKEQPQPVTRTITPTTLAGLKLESVGEVEPHVNMLIYGESGAGKTTLAGTSDLVPEMRNVLLIDIEGGSFTLRHVAPEITRVRIKTWREMDNLYTELREGKHDFRTVIVDSLSEVQKFAMYAIMEGVVAKEEDRDQDVPSLREYMKNQEIIRKFVRGFRDLPMNTIFTALLGTLEDKKRGKTDYYPGMQGKVAKEVSAMVDGVYYLYVKEIDGENHRCLLTSKTEDIVAKDRSDSLEQIIVDPTMEYIYNTLINSGTV